MILADELPSEKYTGTVFMDLLTISSSTSGHQLPKNQSKGIHINVQK